MPAPIALFAFNRPQHLQHTLDALAENELASESSLTFFCDGPRTMAEKTLTDAVRAVCHSEAGRGRFAEVHVVAQARNQGLAPSIIAGVTRILDAHERVIVLEDDLTTSPYFLRYMNDGLTCYEDNPQVASIHGYCFPHAVQDAPETFFLPGADCLGWATWRRAWNIFEVDASTLLAQLDARKLRHAFNVDGCYDYCGMLEDVRDGTVSSWAVRWHAAAFLSGMWTVYPGRSLVFHTGSDSSGTNCGTTDTLDTELTQTPVAVNPLPVGSHPAMTRAFEDFSLRTAGGHGAMRKRRLKRWVKKSMGERYKVVKRLCKEWLPPVLWDALRSPAPTPATEGISFSGPYGDWKSACAASAGYDSDAIFQRMRAAAAQVRDGNALWERDSVCFFHEEYNHHLLSALLHTAARHGGALHVLDFGGALGSTYMQHRQWLSGLREISWSVVEQPHVVACGQQEFSRGPLSFFATVEGACSCFPVNFILLSSVLQYLEKPHAFLKSLCAVGASSLYIGRTPVTLGEDRLMVQRVPESLYPATYPCWFLNAAALADTIGPDYVRTRWVQSEVDQKDFMNLYAFKAG